MWSRRRGTGAAVLGLVVLAACGDGTGPAVGSNVDIAFGTLAPTSMQSLVPLGPMAGTLEEPVSISGSNGVLTLTDVRVVVSEFELKQVEGTCDTAGVSGDDDDCEEFEAPPSFIDVPLGGGTTVAVSQDVPPGTYDRLKFKVEDLEDDEEDDTVAGQITALRDSILAEFPDWPQQASLLVVGTFTPAGGDPMAFRAYFEAEIEIELHMDPPLTIAEGEAPRAVTVELDPTLWFNHNDGTVMNLAEYDYDATGLVVEFEVEMEHGFTKVEHDDDD